MQKCSKELNGEPFSMARVLYHAWQTTVHIAMEAWASIHRIKRGNERREILTAAFELVWYADCTFVQQGVKPKWQTMPPEVFLPRNLATETPSSPIHISTRSISSDTVSHDSEDDRALDQAVDDYLEGIINDLAQREAVQNTQPSTSEQDH